MPKISKDDCVALVGDGAIGSPDVGDGRLIPVLILDCKTRRDLYDLIMLHQTQPPGDAISTWGRPRFSSDSVYLFLEFQRPTPAKAFIEFDLDRHLMLVDGLIQANAAYLQPNNNGNRVIEGIDKEKILIEIPSEGASEPPVSWDWLFKKKLKKKFKKQGLSRGDAIKAADQFILETRQLWSLRQKI